MNRNKQERHVANYFRRAQIKLTTLANAHIAVKILKFILPNIVLLFFRILDYILFLNLSSLTWSGSGHEKNDILSERHMS